MKAGSELKHPGEAHRAGGKPGLRVRVFLGLTLLLWLELLALLGVTTALFYVGLLIPSITAITIARCWPTVVLVMLVVTPLFLLFRDRSRQWLARSAIRHYAWASAILVTLVVLFYSIESWRGNRAWRTLLDNPDRDPDRLRLSSLATFTIDDDDNFAKADPIRSWVHDDSDPFDPFVGLGDAQSKWNWQIGRTTDLNEWIERQLQVQDPPLDPEPTSTAETALTLLRRYNGILAQVRIASTRKAVQYDLPLDEGWASIQTLRVPPWRNLLDLSAVLRLRACARLHAGDASEALDDLSLILRLAELHTKAPLMHETTCGILRHAIQLTWEGLAARQWSPDQLLRIQTQFARLDLLSALDEGLRGEVLMQMDLVETLFPAHSPARSFVDPDNTGARLFLAACRLVYPCGWSLQNQAEFYRLYEQDFGKMFDADSARVFPDAVEALQRSLIHRPPSLDVFSVIFILPRVNHIPGQLTLDTATLQHLINTVQVACALERFRADQAGYPETLSDLAPSYLRSPPLDIISGKPLLYRRLDTGAYRLHSVGWNQTDDNGVAEWRHGGVDTPQVGQRLSEDFGYCRADRGDWVWTVPANRE